MIVGSPMLSLAAVVFPLVVSLTSGISSDALDRLSKTAPLFTLLAAVIASAVAVFGINKARRSNKTKLAFDLAAEMFGDHDFYTRTRMLFLTLTELAADPKSSFVWDIREWYEKSAKGGSAFTPEQFATFSHVLRIYFRLKVFQERGEIDTDVAIQLFRQNYRFWYPFIERLQKSNQDPKDPEGVWSVYLQPVNFLLYQKPKRLWPW